MSIQEFFFEAMRMKKTSKKA